ncbi:MAG: methylmalonyl Co-A mutase-associated GTPase MeaB, partial [Planctomycetota bacterium JB042]
DALPICLLTRAERSDGGFGAIHARLQERIGRAVRVGFTGPPGAGKSTLVEAYALARRAAGDKIAVVAVDPTSPFTGGALLGDRVRMNRIAMDPDCFVRSMASRGSFGGLARTTDEVADVFDAAGFDRVLLETVGVGQSEVDVARASDVTVVVLVPGAGDAVQAMKAGLMEIADVFVVNKADRPGVDRVLAELEEVLELRLDTGRPRPAIVQTVAKDGDWVEELDRAIEEFLAASRASSAFEARRQETRVARVCRIVEDEIRSNVFAGRGLAGRVSELVDRTPGASPYALAETVLAEMGISPGPNSS